jgi:hypothetical protein
MQTTGYLREPVFYELLLTNGSTKIVRVVFNGLLK